MSAADYRCRRFRYGGYSAAFVDVAKELGSSGLGLALRIVARFGCGARRTNPIISRLFSSLTRSHLLCPISPRSLSGGVHSEKVTRLSC